MEFSFSIKYSRVFEDKERLVKNCVDLRTAEREMTEVHTGTGNSPLRKPQFLNRFFASSEERGGFLRREESHFFCQILLFQRVVSLRKIRQQPN
jgi:hypothetical protein